MKTIEDKTGTIGYGSDAVQIDIIPFLNFSQKTPQNIE